VGEPGRALHLVAAPHAIPYPGADDRSSVHFLQQDLKAIRQAGVNHVRHDVRPLYRSSMAGAHSLRASAASIHGSERWLKRRR